MKVGHCTAPLLISLLSACAAGSGDPWAAARPSPDQLHFVSFTDDSVAHVIEIASSRELGRIENLETPGTGSFSADGRMFVTFQRGGSLVALEIATGRVSNLGSPIDAGRISPDGSRVAYLANMVACGTPDPHQCADLVVVPARGGARVTLATGIRVFAARSGSNALFDRYEFAGIDRVVFTDVTGSLRSVAADGSGAAVTLSGPVSSPDQSPVPPTWILSNDGSLVVYTDAAGLHAVAPQGGTARLLSGDPADVPCEYESLTSTNHCAFTPDGQSVALVTSSASDPASVRVSMASLTGAVSFSYPAAERYAHLAAGGLLFVDAQRGWVVGSSAVLRPLGIAFHDAFPWQERDISPNTRWALFSTFVSGLDCPGCRTMKVVSLADDVAWTVADHSLPMKILDAWFSPDSRRVLVLRAGPDVTAQGGGKGGQLYVAPVEGGELRQIDDAVTTAFWADSSHVVVVRFNDAGDRKAGVSVEAVP